MGTHHYVLNRSEDVAEALEKQGAKASDRPIIHMAGQLMGFENSLVLTPYGELWRTSRRLIHKYIGGRGQLAATIAKFEDVEVVETRKSLSCILKHPERLEEHIRKCVPF